MKIKKAALIFLCAALLVSAMSGCDLNATKKNVSASPTASAGGSSPTTNLNLDAAYASNPADAVVMTISGEDVHWDEFFYRLNYYINYVTSKAGNITDWSKEYQEGKTYAQFVVNSATQWTIYSRAIEYGAKQLGVTLTDEDRASIKSDIAAEVSKDGNEEAYLTDLKLKYSSEDLENYLKKISYLADACFTSMYGKDGANLSDSDVSDYCAKDGYIMAKHILLLTGTTDAEGNTAQMSAEDKAAVLKKMQDIYTKLESYKGNDFNAYFTQMMNENSQDPGLKQFPNGYLFQSGDMDSQFEDACKKLDIGKFSSVVETKYGYDIIYRIPINYDTVPIRYQNYQGYTLRYLTAVNMFNSVIDNWMSSQDVKYGDIYNSLDFNTVFKAQ